jgi:MSHA pilin protein MshA
MNLKIEKLAQKGFTLIELIITIVIIGVLAAVAIPKFQNLTSDAEQGVAAGVAAALASATSVNYGRSKVPAAVICTAANTPAGCTYFPMTTCATLAGFAPALADIPTGYTVVANTAAGAAAALTTDGTSANACMVQKTGGTATAAFNAYGA